MVYVIELGSDRKILVVKRSKVVKNMVHACMTVRIGTDTIACTIDKKSAADVLNTARRQNAKITRTR
jgi:hypothetical protein